MLIKKALASSANPLALSLIISRPMLLQTNKIKRYRLTRKCFKRILPLAAGTGKEVSIFSVGNNGVDVFVPGYNRNATSPRTLSHPHPATRLPLQR